MAEGTASGDASPERAIVLGFIPVRGCDATVEGEPVRLAGRPLLGYTVSAALRSSALDRVVVSTDHPKLRDLARELGAEAPFLRPPALAGAGVPIEAVLRHGLEWLEEHDAYRPHIVVFLEISHPLRPPGLIDRVVERLAGGELDTVFVARPERGTIWQETPDGELKQLTGTARQEVRLFKEIRGMATATTSDVVASGERLGHRVGVISFQDSRALVDTQDPFGMELAEQLLSIPIPSQETP